MAKKPFSIRIEQHLIDRFKALSTVLNVDGATLLKEMILEKEKTLTKEQHEAYEALLKVWRE